MPQTIPLSVAARKRRVEPCSTGPHRGGACSGKAPRTTKAGRGWLARSARTGGSLLALGAAWVCLWATTQAAALEQASFSLGAQLLERFGDLAEAPQPIELNGQHLWVASKLSPLSVSEVLDRFEAHCLTGGEARADALDSALTHNARAGLGELDWRRLLIRRAEVDDRGGQLVCLAPDRPLSGPLDLVDRVRTLLTTGRVGAVGSLRYARVAPQPAGGSHILSVWSEASLDWRQAMPTEGDAKGRDPSNAPRPPRSSRTLSATLAERNLAAYSYLSELTPLELLDYYDREMPHRGWARVSPATPDQAPSAVDAFARAFLQREAVTYVVVSDTQVGRAVTLVQSGSLGATR